MQAQTQSEASGQVHYILRGVSTICVLFSTGVCKLASIFTNVINQQTADVYFSEFRDEFQMIEWYWAGWVVLALSAHYLIEIRDGKTR